MDKNKQDGEQRVINVYGFANIGCDQSHATFQTVVQAPPQPVGEAEAAQEMKNTETAASQEESVETVGNHNAQETFVDRVKGIVRKAATKNGQRVESNARGHVGAYIFHIDAEVFCRAMDEMASSYGQDLQAFLGGSLNCVQVTKVCLFIGHVIRMNTINDTSLQMSDILFAFEDYYDNLQTVKAKLGDKKTTSDQNVLLGTFQGLLKKYKG
jgi:hypothetical protein